MAPEVDPPSSSGASVTASTKKNYTSDSELTASDGVLATPTLRSPFLTLDASTGEKTAAAAAGGKGGEARAADAKPSAMGGGFGARYPASQAVAGEHMPEPGLKGAMPQSSGDVEMGSMNGKLAGSAVPVAAAGTGESEGTPLEEWRSTKPLLGLSGSRLSSAPSAASSVAGGPGAAAAAAETAQAAQTAVDSGWKANYVPDIEASRMKQYLTNVVITQVRLVFIKPLPWLAGSEGCW